MSEHMAQGNEPISEDEHENDDEGNSGPLRRQSFMFDSIHRDEDSHGDSTGRRRLLLR